MTTNLLSNMDDTAMKRRVDYYLKFDVMKKEQIKNMFRRLYPEQDSNSFYFSVSGLQLTPCILQKFFVRHLDSDVVLTHINELVDMCNHDYKIINNNNNTIFTFLPCSFNFYSDIDSNKNMGHAVSFIHDNDNKLLYFYDPYLIPDRRINEHKLILKFLRRFVSETIIENGRKVSSYDDLSRYTDENGNNLYCKVQQTFADDPLHSLCVLISLIPYICLQFLKDYNPSKTKKQLQFYLWFLYFSAIIYRQKKIDGSIVEMEITTYQSNLIIVLPFIFIGIYNIVENLMNDKVRTGMKTTVEDIKLKDTMFKQTEFLSKNLIDIMTDINNKVYNTNEIPSKYM